jgi:hypothetical protein
VTRSEKSAEAVVVAGNERRAEREGVFKDIPMVHTRHQKSATAERSGEAPGEAGRDPGSDEAGTPLMIPLFRYARISRSGGAIASRATQTTATYTYAAAGRAIG